MEQQLYSLSKLFTERLYRIPDYQRGYAWTEKHLKDFWDDLVQLEEDKKHYLGVLTLEPVPKVISETWRDDYWIISSKGYSPFYVIDGQQRLTTAIILIQTIIESVAEGTSLNYDTTDVIRKRFICDSKDGGISRSYMFGYEIDNPSYNCLKTNIFMQASGSSETPQETIYTHNLEFAKSFFKKKLEALSLDKKESIYRKLNKNLLFNTYNISTDIDVFVAFETMNNRGKLLSYLELLKNRLIYLSTKFEEEDCEKDKLRTSINEAWKSMYYYLGKNKEKPLDDDLFLSSHFTIYFDNITASKRSRESFILDIDDIYSINNFVYRRHPRVDYSSYLLERKFTVKSIMSAKTNTDIPTENGEEKETLQLKEVYAYVTSLQSCVELWYKILNPSDSDFSVEERFWINKLIRLSRRDSFFPAVPLIMVFFQKENKQEERIKLLKVIEKISFLNLLAPDYPLFYYHKNYVGSSNMFEMARKLNKGSLSPEKIIKDLEETRHRITNDEDFLNYVIQRFKSSNFYKWHGIKYFFYEYEIFLQKKSRTERQKLSWSEFASSEFASHDHETIEHIYPQNARKYCWTSRFSSYSASQRNILKHSLGNLLPLSKPKNSSFSNKCFTEKISDDDTTVGYRYGSYSENEITQYSDWTAKEILERGLKLLDFMTERWAIPLVSKDQDYRIDILNLDFVEK